MIVHLGKYFFAENNILSSFKLAWPWSISRYSSSSHLMRQANVSSCNVQLIYDRRNDEHQQHDHNTVHNETSTQDTYNMSSA